MSRTRTSPREDPPAPPVLQEVDYQVRLLDLLAEVRLTQVYHNAEDVPVEAVFTFPVPLAATLLALEVELGERRLVGTVVPRPQATEAYEDALADGDAAVLLEQVGPGLYTANCGNLLPGETARLHLRWAELFVWQGDTFRFCLPTTIAPRYGDPGDQLQPHQVPQADLLTENRCHIAVEALGSLVDAEFTSPTHPVRVEREASCCRIELVEDGTAMDRDFVLLVTTPAGQRGFAVRETDGGATVIWASFHPLWDEVSQQAPRCLKLVVDCSGSMAGDSIAQARQAVDRILEQLRPQDAFNLVLFGDQPHVTFPRCLLADAKSLARARRVLEGMDADLGGTEVGLGLQAAYGSAAPEGITPDLLLITDGEVWNTDPVLAEAEASGHRVFAVGVGSAVSEAFLSELARRTGGACELVTPNEDMAARIVRHAGRIWTPRVRHASLRWPGRAVLQVPATVGAVYRGETLHVFARCAGLADGPVGLDLELQDGRHVEYQTEVRPAPWEPRALPLLARLAAAQRLRQEAVAPAEAVQLAVDQQLVTPQTCLLVIAVRAKGEKADELPALRQVAHTLAAGWGGTGSVMHSLPGSGRVCAPATSYPLFQRKAFVSAAPHTQHPSREPAVPSDDEIRCSRAAVTAQPSPSLVAAWGDEFVRQLCAALAQGRVPGSLDALVLLGLGGEGQAFLQSLVDAGHDEAAVVALLLHTVVGALPPGSLGRNALRRVRKTYRLVSQRPGCEDVARALGAWTASRVAEV